MINADYIIKLGFTSESVQMLCLPSKPYLEPFQYYSYTVQGAILGGLHKAFSYYHLKWEKALFASAMRCISSLLAKALPVPVAAFMISVASFKIIKGLFFGFSSKSLELRERAASTSQEMASELRLGPLTSIGTM